MKLTYAISAMSWHNFFLFLILINFVSKDAFDISVNNTNSPCSTIKIDLYVGLLYCALQECIKDEKWIIFRVKSLAYGYPKLNSQQTHQKPKPWCESEE